MITMMMDIVLQRKMSHKFHSFFFVKAIRICICRRSTATIVRHRGLVSSVTAVALANALAATAEIHIFRFAEIRNREIY